MGLINRAILLVFLLLALLTFSCDTKEKNARGPSPLIHPDKWLVTGRVANEGFTNGEVLALAMDGMRYRAPIASDDSFGIALPGNASYAVHFLSQAQAVAEATSTKMSPKDTPPILSFEESPDVGIRDTLRLPKVLFNRQLDFGEIDIKEREAYPTINPATRLDFDYDGKNDLSDVDDNSDGLPDEEQRKSSERVEVCHTSEDNRSTTQKIPLSTLYQHTSHGDPLGPCQIAVAPNPNAAPKNTSIGGGTNAPSSPTASSGGNASSGSNASKKVANNWRPSDYKPNSSVSSTDKKEEKKSDAKADDKKTTDSKNDKNGETGATKSGDSDEGDEDSEEEDSDDFYSDDEEEEEEDPRRRNRSGNDDDDGDVKEPENRFKKPKRKQTSTRGPKKKATRNGDTSEYYYFFE